MGSPLQSVYLRAEIGPPFASVALFSEARPVPEGTNFPEIAILAGEGPLHAGFNYTLRLAARPSDPDAARFRRGDANDDERTDISDAVRILIWRFSGGAAPPCLEAADVNSDGLHDVSDAVFLLSYLFFGGPPPAPPGLHSCGAAAAMSFSCVQSSCAV